MIILKNATFIDWIAFKFTKVDVVVSERGMHFLSDSDFDTQNIETIDCTGKYITKSFACGHHHVYSAMATGMPAPDKTPHNFYEILKYIWWQLDKSLNMEMIKLSAYLTAMECAKNGVTFVIDHHASPSCVEGSLQTIADAFNEVGVGHLLCYEISDRDGVDVAHKGLIETENYLKNNQGLVGLHASFTLTNKTLQKAVALAEKYNSGIHVHVAEDIYDQENCYDIHNKRVIERFNDVGMLNLPKSIFVHCLYLTTDERKLLEKSKAYIVQNVESNLNNNVGQFRSCHLGDNIMMGTDGMHSDMLRAAKATYYTGQLCDSLDIKQTYQRFRAVNNYTQQHGFTGDGDNNLVVLDYMPATEFNESNFLSHFLYAIESRHVQHVIANGKLIVKDKQLVNVNENEIKSRSRELCKILWAKMKESSNEPVSMSAI